MMYRLYQKEKIVGFSMGNEWYLTMSAVAWSRKVIRHDDKVGLTIPPLGVESLPFEK